MLLEMRVAGLAIDPGNRMPFVILQDLNKQNAVPIWIGVFEASAIATELEQVQMTRPMTHDLLKNVVGILGAELLRVEITELKENTFYGLLRIRKTGGEEVSVDARPSDAIALALRTKSPIFVDDQVVAKSRMTKPPQERDVSDILKNLAPEAFGKYKM